ncbi:unnamed protein product [Rhizoctonia solani]|uniref:Alcohol dehydrogenase-like C-terminal domain-containing protein n=1 Tax=Rhizoctonia solani TaxID=456999 RepID=A0A8H3C7S3_9AGAM|nr:unnamed protein product [Rhizoctonia solani]
MCPSPQAWKRRGPGQDPCGCVEREGNSAIFVHDKELVFYGTLKSASVNIPVGFDCNRARKRRRAGPSAQFTKAAGARVIATTSSEDRASKYKALGVDHVINYRGNPDWADEVKKLTGGLGVDQAFEIGGKGTLIEAIRAIKPGGVVHVISVWPNAATTSVNELAMSLLLKQGKLNGVVVGVVGGRDVGQRLDPFISKHRITPLVDSKVFEWKEAKDASE